ncbi:hypothetical protein FN846DRAFT_911624 [Sphaerosporella brunnea]|uniref:Uncharacterized protein n=1 Tax=Sphaerosporella brunnea TaxID=1250544 RepID=A0A5J5EJG6_9PEZI|nr:hypothetical protein FN846DRAFT_911624 [Sphaerosporella brunnea]
MAYFAGCYEVTVDEHFQYGQKNKEGECRFLVYHKKGRKPFQHRFIPTAIGSNAAEWRNKLAHNLGHGSLADQISSAVKKFVGDYLHGF